MHCLYSIQYIAYTDYSTDYLYKTCTVCCRSEFLISFEAWAKLAQQWLVCAPLGIHLEPINKELILLVII